MYETATLFRLIIMTSASIDFENTHLFYIDRKGSDMIIGPHISIAGGYRKAVEEALSIGANAMQAFTRNPRGGSAAELDIEDLRAADVLMQLNNFKAILMHAPYTLNPASARPEVVEFAKQCFSEDMERMVRIPSSLYVFHPGSRTTLPYDTAVQMVADVLRHGMIEDSDTYVLLETMSGKGSEIGKSFEEIRDMIDAAGDFPCKDKLGVCIDTCHLYCAGYDIVNDLDGVLQRFDDIVGLDRIKAVHLNDTVYPYASNKDRHARMGEGEIGLDAIVRIINHPKLKDLPFFLETPHADITGYGDEIKMLRYLRK